ncbi:MAG: hypothetical protein E7B59_13290 [Enterobacteriaceae bacterium]|nr:hypothetical protein [Enterobacteriaceae bacterium]
MRKMVIRRNKVSLWLLISTFILLTISLTKTNSQHEDIVNILRIIIGGFSVLLLLIDFSLCIIKRNISKTRFAILTISFTLFLYAMIRSVAFGGVSYFFSDSDILSVVLLSFLFLWASSAVGGELTYSEADIAFKKYIPIYCSISILLTIFFGGLTLDFPPRFIFNDLGLNSYSQGISKVYMIGALVSLLKYLKTKTKIPLAFSILMLCLSFLGGARGDFAIGFIIYSIIIFLYNKKLGAFLFALSIAVYSMSFLNLTELSNDFYIVNRFMQLDTSNLGQRDVLATNAITLLNDNSICVFFGCGFNAFQSYWGYRIGLYPHNIAIESAITFGVPMAGFLIVCLAYSLLKLYRKNMLENSFVIIGIYIISVGMKSGTILDLMMVGFYMNIVITAISGYSLKFNSFYVGSK